MKIHSTRFKMSFIWQDLNFIFVSFIKIYLVLTVCFLPLESLIGFKRFIIPVWKYYVGLLVYRLVLLFCLDSLVNFVFTFNFLAFEISIIILNLFSVPHISNSMFVILLITFLLFITFKCFNCFLIEFLLSLLFQIINLIFMINIYFLNLIYFTIFLLFNFYIIILIIQFNIWNQFLMIKFFIGITLMFIMIPHISFHSIFTIFLIFLMLFPSIKYHFKFELKIIVII
jgi:hypothetical protein